jgi:hypothetical protein
LTKTVFCDAVGRGGLGPAKDLVAFRVGDDKPDRLFGRRTQAEGIQRQCPHVDDLARLVERLVGREQHLVAALNSHAPFQAVAAQGRFCFDDERLLKIHVLWHGKVHVGRAQDICPALKKCDGLAAVAGLQSDLDSLPGEKRVWPSSTVSWSSRRSGSVAT